MTGFPALGFDPAPGDVSVLEGYVDALTTGCEGTDDARAMLDGGDDASWKGLSATAFRAAMDEDFRPQLVDTHEALQTSRDALRTWTRQLTSFQQRALQLEEEAAAALANVNARARAHDNALDDRESEDADPNAVADTNSALNRANGELESIRSEAARLKIEVDNEAEITARTLNDAGDLLDDYKGNRFSNFFGKAGDWLADAGNWLMDNVVPILEDILRAALPIIAILSIFIPALGPIALGISIALLAIDGLQALTGRGSWSDFAVGALGMLAGGALGQVAKSVIGPGGQVLIPSIQGMTPALAGGGTVAGSLAVALNVNLPNMVANTYWTFTTAKGAAESGQSFVDSLGGPWRNLAERVDNTVHGHGPKTDEELNS